MSEEKENLAGQWRQNRGEIVELPSGKRARLVRTIDINLAIKSGTIPNPLRDVIASFISDGLDSKRSFDETSEVASQFGDFMSKVVCDAFVDPKCVMPPKEDADGNEINPILWHSDNEDEISYYELELDDRSFVYSIAQGGNTDLKRFRQVQNEHMESLGDVKKVQVPPKRATRAKSTKQ